MFDSNIRLKKKKNYIGRWKSSSYKKWWERWKMKMLFILFSTYLSTILERIVFCQNPFQCEHIFIYLKLFKNYLVIVVAKGNLLFCCICEVGYHVYMWFCLLVVSLWSFLLVLWGAFKHGLSYLGMCQSLLFLWK
jgi:hypothetical protein